MYNYTEYNQQGNVFSAFDPSKCTHTLGAVGTVHSAVDAQERPARPPHVTINKIHLFETR